MMAMKVVALNQGRGDGNVGEGRKESTWRGKNGKTRKDMTVKKTVRKALLGENGKDGEARKEMTSRKGL